MAKQRDLRIKRTLASNIFDVCNYIFMACLAIVTLYPIWHVAMASISNPAAVMTHTGLIFWPLENLEFGSYGIVLKNPMIVVGYLNTFKYVIVGTLINMFMTILAAYCLSRQFLMVRNAVMYMIIFTMYFQGGLIPSFLLVKSLGLLDTMWAILLPGAISTYNMIIMRTSFAGVPAALEESAMLDGASDMTILIKILLPLTGPTIAVMVLFYAVGHWNSWFSAMVYLNTREKFPLQLVLREILLANAVDNSTMAAAATDSGAGDKIPLAETVKYATIMVATIPILLVYPFLQKYFVKGVMIGAIKG